MFRRNISRPFLISKTNPSKKATEAGRLMLLISCLLFHREDGGDMFLGNDPEDPTLHGLREFENEILRIIFRCLFKDGVSSSD
jgi:hypothetical protein